MSDRPYYEAYDERYRIAHAAGLRWMGDEPSRFVRQTLEKYNIPRDRTILELGCGEGRDAFPLLRAGYRVLATDISPEAIDWCRSRFPAYADRFRVLDCLRGELDGRYPFVYAVALLHMLVYDEDRCAFYRFVRDHLEPDGLALIGTMGDGEREMCSDVSRAFELQERESEIGPIRVTATSCRVVSFPTFEREIAENGLSPVEKGVCSVEPEFDSMMIALVKRA